MGHSVVRTESGQNHFHSSEISPKRGTTFSRQRQFTSNKINELTHVRQRIVLKMGQEHRNIEKLLTILERELEVFDRGDRPDYEVIRAVISYFEVYPEVYHHPQEDLVFAKLRMRDAAAAAKVGDLAREHQKGAERLRSVAHAIDNVLADRELLRQSVDAIVRDFIEHERRHMMMED